MSSEENDAEQVIWGILESLQHHNLTNLNKLLLKLDLTYLDVESSDQLLIMFLEEGFTQNEVEGTKIIFNYWRGFNPEEEKFSTWTYIFTLRAVKDEVLSFLIRIFPEITFLNVLQELADNDSSDLIESACYRADRLFVNIPNEDYKVLYLYVLNQAIELGNSNYRVKEFLIDRLKQTSDFAPIPKWVKNYHIPTWNDKKILGRLPYDIELEIPQTPQLNYELPTPEEALLLMTGGMEYTGLEKNVLSDIKKLMIDKYKDSSTDEKIAMVEKSMNTQDQLLATNNPTLFKLYGPNHPEYDSILDPLGNHCQRYGGCRMHLCQKYQDITESETLIENQYWFTNSCEFCYLGIRKVCHAVRRPLENGGWVGCYCSWKCVRESLSDVDSTLQNEMINTFENDCIRYGIQDREYKN
jgi:hypothetical protein